MKYTSEKGITLIALVITIIVLLILAGVTINMVLDSDGIIKQAQDAEKAQKKAELKEKIELWNGNVKTAEHGGKAITEEEYEEFKTEIEGLAENVGIENVNISTGKIEIDGKEVSISLPSDIDTRGDITFILVGLDGSTRTCTAKEGMTWEEFVGDSGIIYIDINGNKIEGPTEDSWSIHIGEFFTGEELDLVVNGGNPVGRVPFPGYVETPESVISDGATYAFG